MAKPVPCSRTELTVNAEVPDEVRVSVFVEVVLTVMLPKASVVALSVSCGVEVEAIVPLPLRLIVIGGA